MATDPVTFSILILLPKAFQLQEDICLENDKTKERLLTEMKETDLGEWDGVGLLISRCSLGSTDNLILGQEIHQKTICLTEELKVVPI
jgi:hypothetical protein